MPIAKSPLQLAEERNPSIYNVTSNPLGTLNIPNNVVSPTKPITVATSDTARNNLNNIQNTMTQAEQGMQIQTANQKQVQSDLLLKQKQLSQAKVLGYTENEQIQTDAQGNVLPKPTIETKDNTSKTIADFIGTDSEAPPYGTDEASLQKWASEKPEAFDIWATANNWTQTAKDSILKTPDSQMSIEMQRLKDERDKTQKDLEAVRNGTFPLSASQQAQLDGLSKAYDRAIEAQITANKNYEGAMTQAGISAGRQRYAPEMEAGNLKTVIDSGVTKISELNDKKASALAQLQEGFKQNNIELIKSSWNTFNESEKLITDNLQKMIDDIHTQEKAIIDAKIKYQEQTQKDINGILSDLSKTPGVPQSVKNLVAQSGSLAEAIQNAGNYLETGTGDVGLYAQYRKDQVNNGMTALDFTSWKAKNDADALKQKSAESYASAYASASGKAKAESDLGVSDPVENALNTNPDNQSILAQTGLSIPAFGFLTVGSSALTRMTSADRQKYMKEAENWANSKGIDISTFASQYKAYNAVVERNVGVGARVGLAANDINLSLNNLDKIAKDAELSKLNIANVAKIWAGQQINDKLAAQYAFNLKDLKSAVAYFFAAQRGNNTTDDTDMREAEAVIKMGLADKSIEGLKETIKTTAERYSEIANQSVNSARKQVWDLFGVGSKFIPPKKTYKNPTEYINDSPENETNFETQTNYLRDTLKREPTAEEVFQYINQ